MKSFGQHQVFYSMFILSFLLAFELLHANIMTVNKRMGEFFLTIIKKIYFTHRLNDLKIFIQSITVRLYLEKLSNVSNK